jgi:hypothetical protein
MSTASFKVETIHWPYGLEVIPVDGGLLLRPKKKARAGWTKLFQKGRAQRDELAELSALQNKFDNGQWQW